MTKAGFKPVVGENPVVLILGSMPSEKSLQQTEYYAHPQNAFWPIMGELLGFDANTPYKERTTQLMQHHIALWDVIKQCTRAGSLDTSIDKDSIVTNNFVTLFTANPTIRHVFFNGHKAEQEFNRRVLPALADAGITLNYMRLPSTSPAHTLKREDKLREWSILKKMLEKK